MPLPAPYLPEVKGTTAQDVANLFLAGERLKSMKIQNMIAQDEIGMADVASGAWMQGQGNQLASKPFPQAPPQVPDSPQTPEQPQKNILAPTQQGGISATLDSENKMAGFKPAASPKEIDSMFKSDTKDPEKDQEKSIFSDKKYQVQVPGRPDTEYLQQKVREGKIHPRAAYLYDMGTQQLRQKQEAVLMKQSVDYGNLNKQSYKDAIESGDMKSVKRLLEQAKIDLPNNPIVQRNSDFMIRKIDNGEVIRPTGKAAKEPANNDVLIRQKYEKDIRKEHPDWDQTDIAAEAAKRVETEQDARKAKQQHTTFEIKSDFSNDKAPKDNLTETSVIKGALREKLGREPSQTELLKEMSSYKAEKSGDAAKARLKGIEDSPPEGSASMKFEDIAQRLGTSNTALMNMVNERVDDPKYQPFGKYRQNNAKRIMFENAVAAKLDENGIDPQQLAIASKSVKADTKSLLNLQTAADAVDQSVLQSRNNAALVKTANDKYERSGYPGPNKFLDWANKNLSSEERKQFEISLKAFSREYMKVVTGSARSVSELSIGAQATADELLSKFDSWKVLNASISQAQSEIDQVPKSYEKQIDEIKRRLSKEFSIVGKKQGDIEESRPLSIKTKEGENGKKLTTSIAMEYAKRANGDRAKAEKMAKADGYEW